MTMTNPKRYLVVRYGHIDHDGRSGSESRTLCETDDRVTAEQVFEDAPVLGKTDVVLLAIGSLSIGGATHERYVELKRKRGQS